MAIVLSGSLILSGSLEATGGVTISGSIASASFATTSSYSLNALTSSNALTASSADTLYVRNNVTALGSITAQTLIVQTVTSSVLFTTGSNKIGSSLSNVQELTGSVGITGSLSVSTNGTEFQVSAGGVNIGNVLTDNHIISGSVVINPNGLFVSSSGNVGIGSTSPAFKLETLGTSVIVAGFGRSDYGATNVTLVGLSGYRDVYKSAIGVVRTGDYDVGDIIVCLNSAANSTVVSASDEKIRIKSNGNVGIGTTAPTSIAGYGGLTINGTSGGYAYFNINGTDTGRIITDSTNFYFDNVSTGALVFRTTSGSTERMRITSAGLVGIGTTSPQAMLSINSNFNSATAATYTNSSLANINSYEASSEGYLRYLDISMGSGNVGSAIRFLTATSNAATSERMRILSDGRVAIGRSNPEPGVKFLIADAGGIGMEFSPNGNVVGENRLLSYDRVAFTAIPMNYSASVHKFLGGNVYIESAAGLRLYTEGNGAYWMLRTYNAVSNQLRFNYQGTDLASIATGTGNYTALSDINKKKDFEPSQVGLNEVLGLKPTLYRMKTEDGTQEKHLGFIAQEVKEFIPQAYSETGEGDDKFIGLTEMPIIAALTKAIQELSAKNTSLEERLLALENAQ